MTVNGGSTLSAISEKDIDLQAQALIELRHI
jgi:hypothetical protein